VVFRLPIIFEPWYWLNRQIVVVYDTRLTYGRSDRNDSIPSSYMMGGMPYAQGRISFDFNFTFRGNETDPFRDIGLLILNSRSRFIHETLLHDNIFIQT
jgi:hypothetical protein